MHQYDFVMCAMLAGSKVPGERSEGSWRAGGSTVQQNGVGAKQEGDGAPGFCGRNTTPPADTWPADQQQTPRQSPVRPRSRATDSGSDSSSPKAREIEDCYLRSAATNAYSALWADAGDAEGEALPKGKARGKDGYTGALAPGGRPREPPAHKASGMMASRGMMLVLGGRGAGPVHNNPPFRRRVNMALRGVACVPMGLLPGPQSGAIEEYSNMAATKKKHVMDKDRRMQNTPLGFVVPEGGAAVAAAEPHFTDLEEVL